ncbi:alpha/beta hydrolase [Mycetocola sp. JXN-3]|uniref:alpha/beta hydrolase n=1 Tax=Mycetocola sp. JXN-3 TaxID=2116510 RepID=UPI00165D0795|nr:alpha/beta hydrolase [Mycetocola sp. JXN-3]
MSTPAATKMLLSEDQADASWIEAVAAAFENAGSGSLSDFEITLAGTVAVTGARGLQTLLLDKNLTPAQVAATWSFLSGSTGFNADEFIRSKSFELASLNGIPFTVMDQAGRYALDYALDPLSACHVDGETLNLREAYRRMGFKEGERSLEDFKKDLEAIRKSLNLAQARVAPGETIQLVSLGRHDGAMTAGISMGNMDEASTVGVFVSGMMSNVREMSDAFDAFNAIRRGATSNTAMVTWIGYHAPNMLEETVQNRADAGAPRLASFLDGITAQRAGNPVNRLVGIGHSYGTNVLAEALKRTDAHVNAYVTLGSAGLKYGTTADQLGVDEIHATHADGDNIAQTLGRYVQFRPPGGDGGGWYEPRVDPRDLEGAHEFSSEETEDGKAVTMHNLVNPIDWSGSPEAQWLADNLDGTAAADEVGYLNPDSSTVGKLNEIMRGTWAEK